MDYLRHLKELSTAHMQALSQHSVLSHYWQDLSLILKGSTARGYADQYSDIDFVLFMDTPTFDAVVAEYVRQGLIQREDGVFLPLGDWKGHYNCDTYAHLEQSLSSDDFSNIWEYTNVEIMHDPTGAYARILNEKGGQFMGRLDRLIRGHYLTVQLQLDWMRQPLRRADRGAALLYGTSFWQACLRLVYLLNGKPYPCDKWLFYYADGLPRHQEAVRQIKAYFDAFATLSALSKGRDLTEYPMHREGTALTALLADLLREQYGDAQWITEWYLYA